MEAVTNVAGLGCVILAGGKSSRMGGGNKALLKIGDRTYLECIAAELSSFEERLLSGGGQELAELVGFWYVPDLFPGSGPMGGIYSALLSCTSSALFVLPCDMPYFRHELIGYLQEEMTEDDDAIIFEDASHRLQPLCGIYTKKCISAMKSSLEQGLLKMSGLTKELCIHVIPAPEQSSSELLFRNINRKEDLERGSTIE